MGRTTTRNQSQVISLTVRGEELNKEKIMGITGFTESTVESLFETTPHALQDMVETKISESEAKQEAEQAKKKAKSKGGGRKKKVTRKPSKRAKALGRLLDEEQSGKVHDLAEWMVDNPGQSKPVEGSNPDWYGMRCLLRALYRRGMLDEEMERAIELYKGEIIEE